MGGYGLKKSALLLGGNGFIGTSLLKKLVKSPDFNNIVVLSRSRTLPQGFSKVKFVIGDLSNYNLVSSLINDADIVFNLINSNMIFSSNADQEEFSSQFYRESSTYKLYSLCSLHNIPLVIFSSGGAIYGNHEQIPIKENEPLNPISNYGQSKKVAELLANYFELNFGLRYISLRIANAYGPGQMPNKGQGLVSIALHSLVQGFQIKKFGNEQLIRDYIYIDDVVSAILALYSSGGYSQCYNIGTGVGTSFQGLINHIDFISKSRVDFQIVDSRCEDVDYNVLDIGKIQRDTSWSPKVTIEQGLKSSYEWIKVFCNAKK